MTHSAEEALVRLGDVALKTAKKFAAIDLTEAIQKDIETIRNALKAQEDNRSKTEAELKSPKECRVCKIRYANIHSDICRQCFNNARMALQSPAQEKHLLCCKERNTLEFTIPFNEFMKISSIQGTAEGLVHIENMQEPNMPGVVAGLRKIAQLSAEIKASSVIQSPAQECQNCYGEEVTYGHEYVGGEIGAIHCVCQSAQKRSDDIEGLEEAIEYLETAMRELEYGISLKHLNKGYVEISSQSAHALLKAAIRCRYAARAKEEK